MNTTDFLQIATAICPDRDCIVFEGRRFTFAQLNARVNQLRGALERVGLGKGDRIGTVSVNRNECVEAYFATAKLGGIFVPLNYRAKAEELAFMIECAHIKLLFVDERYMDLVESIRGQLSKLIHVVPVEGEREGDYESLIGGESTEESPTVDIGDDDTTILLFTSGTTGQPKGVPLRHDAFVAYSLDNVEPADPEFGERTIVTVPLYHVAGIQAMLPAIYGGRTLILMRQFELEEWLETVQRERATRAMLVPTMLKWIVEAPKLGECDLSSLEVITYGAAPMPFEVICKAIEALPHVSFINGYGQTESAATLTTLGPEDHRLSGTEAERQKKLSRLRHSIGRPLPDVRIRIVDETGGVRGPEDPREIQAKG
ncbi:MAG: class I adenylate-forming enzyme family protein, partial [Thermoleophilia bacterium]